MKIEILVPRAIPADDGTTAVQFQRRPSSLNGLRVGFLDNTKPNADKLLRDIEARLRSRHDLRSVLHRHKRDSSGPAAENLLDEMTRECDLVVIGVAD